MSDENVDGTEETTEPTDLEKALALLEPVIDGGGSEDDMVVHLIQSGYKFSKAARLMNLVLQSKGLKMSPKERFAAVEEVLMDRGFEPSDWSDVDSMAVTLSEEVEATSKGQAIAAIKKFAKQNGVKLPAKPKGGGGGTRVSAFDRFYTWANENAEASDDDVQAFVDGLGVTEKQATKLGKRFVGILGFARTFQA